MQTTFFIELDFDWGVGRSFDWEDGLRVIKAFRDQHDAAFVDGDRSLARIYNTLNHSYLITTLIHYVSHFCKGRLARFLGVFEAPHLSKRMDGLPLTS